MGTFTPNFHYLSFSFYDLNISSLPIRHLRYASTARSLADHHSIKAMSLQ